nr:serine hydrolase [Lysinibacillus timonensis]
MVEAIYESINKADCKIHMFVKETRNNTLLICERFNEEFSSASLIKVPILMAVLHFVEQNHRLLQESIRVNDENKVDFSIITEQNLRVSTLYELLVWMIISSDNTATNVLIDYIGMNELNNYFQLMGLTQTRLQRKMMDVKQMEQGVDNMTSARDMEHLFSRIYRQDLLSTKYSELAINILCRQRIQDCLKRYIEDDVRVAHKTGSLDTVIHDVGIVFNDVSDYLIGIFITEVKDTDNAKQLIGRISKEVYHHLVRRKGGNPQNEGNCKYDDSQFT